MSNTTNKIIKFLFLLKYWYIFVVLVGICSILAPSAEAQGIEVSPSVIQLDLATDRPQVVLTYTNHTNQLITLTFSTSNDIGLENSSQNFKYGLSSWVSFSNSSLLLNPGEKSTETVFIDKDRLSPGGHYGSVLATITAANPTSGIAIKSVLATLLFVRTHTGREYEKGAISTFAPEQNFWDFPESFLFRFTNSGDTYLIPYGSVHVFDMWRNTVGKGMLNSGSLLVLPESLRRLEIPTQSFGILWPGMYHATLSLHFGKTNQKLTSTTTFFSFGTLPAVPIIIVLLILGNGYLFFKMKKLSSRT